MEYYNGGEASVTTANAERDHIRLFVNASRDAGRGVQDSHPHQFSSPAVQQSTIFGGRREGCDRGGWYVIPASTEKAILYGPSIDQAILSSEATLNYGKAVLIRLKEAVDAGVDTANLALCHA